MVHPALSLYVYFPLALLTLSSSLSSPVPSLFALITRPFLVCPHHPSPDRGSMVCPSHPSAQLVYPSGVFPRAPAAAPQVARLLLAEAEAPRAAAALREGRPSGTVTGTRAAMAAYLRGHQWLGTNGRLPGDRIQPRVRGHRPWYGPAVRHGPAGPATGYGYGGTGPVVARLSPSTPAARPRRPPRATRIYRPPPPPTHTHTDTQTQ